MYAPANEQARSKRIDSWKSIAQYLGRSSRTVQRWHRAYGLPVRRLGGDSSSVFAYAEELDSWLRNRESGSDDASSRSAKPFLIPHTSLERVPVSTSDSVAPPIAGSEKARAAALVTHANRLWASLSAQNLQVIARHFREAIDLDPDNADALAGLSYALLAGGVLGHLRIPEAYVSAQEAATRSIALNPDLAEARCAEAWLKMVLERDWKAARQGFDSVLQRLEPPVPGLIGSGLMHIAEGDPKQAADQLGETVRQFSLIGPAARLCCYSLYLAGESSEALSFAEEIRTAGHAGMVLDTVEALASIRCEAPEVSIARIQALTPDSANPTMLRGVLGYALALNGQAQRANEVLNTITQGVDGRRGADPFAVALILIGLGERHGAVPWIEESYERGSLWSLGFPIDPALRPLRDEPAYRAFMSRADYPAPR